MVERTASRRAAARKGLGLSPEMMEMGPGAAADGARTTQTTTMPREFYYGTVVPYLAARAKLGLPATWNWLSVEAVRRFMEEDAEMRGDARAVAEVPHPPDRRHRTLEHDGVERTVSEWSRLRKIPKHKIIDRMDRLWTSGQVLEFDPPPVRTGGKSPAAASA